MESSRSRATRNQLANVRKFNGDDDPLYHVINPRIGQGMSRVAKVRRKADNKVRACKIFRLKRYKSNLKKLETELSGLELQSRRMLKNSNHFDWAPEIAIKEQQGDKETELRIYMPYCNMGSLQDVIERRETTSAHFDEIEIILIFQNLNSQLTWVHNLKNLLHRDIKPGNVFLHSTRGSDELQEKYLSQLDDRVEVFLSDWDASRHYQVLSDDADYSNSGLQGTAGFIAPECYNPPFICNEKSDRYALGYTMFCLCELKTALSSSSPSQQNIGALGGVNVTVPISSTVDKWTTSNQYSDGLRDLINRLTDNDPDVRPSYGTTFDELGRLKLAVWKSANGWETREERESGYLTDELERVGLNRDGTSTSE